MAATPSSLNTGDFVYVKGVQTYTMKTVLEITFASWNGSIDARNSFQHTVVAQKLEFLK